MSDIKKQNINIIIHPPIFSKDIIMFGIPEHKKRATRVGSSYHGVVPRHYNERKVLIGDWRR